MSVSKITITHFSAYANNKKKLYNIYTHTHITQFIFSYPFNKNRLWILNPENTVIFICMLGYTFSQCVCDRGVAVHQLQLSKYLHFELTVRYVCFSVQEGEILGQITYSSSINSAFLCEIKSPTNVNADIVLYECLSLCVWPTQATVCTPLFRMLSFQYGW